MPTKKNTVKELFDILKDVEQKNSSTVPTANDPEAELTKNLVSHNSRTRSEQAPLDALMSLHPELAEKLRDMQSDRTLRENFALRLFIYMCVWSGLILGIVILGSITAVDFKPDPKVLLTLVGSTTIQVIGLVYTMVKGLFIKTPHSKTKKKKKEKEKE